MDSRRERELAKQLPFALDPPSTIADSLPIDTERIIGFTLIVATYILLGLLPFILVCTVMGQVDVTTREAMWQILARTMSWIYLGAAVWMFFWFLIYVVLDWKSPSSLARVSGAGRDDEDDEEEALPRKPVRPANRPNSPKSR